jgi:hypothetical protein
MTAGRAAEECDALRIDSEHRRIGAQVANRRFDVVRLRRERRFIAQAVIDGRHGVPAADQSQCLIDVLLGAAAPSAAMHPNYQRKRLCRGSRLVQVEQVRRPLPVCLVCQDFVLLSGTRWGGRLRRHIAGTRAIELRRLCGKYRGAENEGLHGSGESIHDRLLGIRYSEPAQTHSWHER